MDSPHEVGAAAGPSSNEAIPADPAEEHWDASSVASEYTEDPPGHDTLLLHLLESLESIESRGDFAAIIPCAANFKPHIHVQGVGHVQLPLSKDQARQIIEQAHPAPYGKGSETLVDEAVRRTFEIDPDSFEIRNPEHWNLWVRKVMTRALRKMGVDAGNVQAELYKMLIYEEEAMFKAHTDTEKIPGMFATMVISLPSRHMGGDVVVKHCGKRKKLSTCSENAAVLAWYSDVSHEVLPVTSGYRWVLTYNLAVPPEHERPTAALSKSVLKPLEHSLRRWLLQLENEETPLEHLYFSLDHEYTEAQISLRALKGADYTRISALQQVSADVDIDIFLAVLEKKESGSCEVEYDPYGWERDRRNARDDWGVDEDEDADSDDREDSEEEDYHRLESADEVSYQIKQLVDLDGKVLLSDVSTSEDFEEHLIQQSGDLFEGTVPEEEYEEFMGNSGPQATHWYRRTVAVIVPRNSAGVYLNARLADIDDGCDDTRDKLISLYANRCSDPRIARSVFETMQDLCQGTNNWEFAGHGRSALAICSEALLDAVKAALVLGEIEFFKQLLLKWGRIVPKTVLDAVKDRLQTPNPQFGRIAQCMLSMLAAYPNISDRYDALQALFPLGTDLHADHVSFIDRVVADAVQDCKTSRRSFSDARALMGLFKEYSQAAFCIHNLGPFLPQKVQQQEAPFVLGILNNIYVFDNETRDEFHAIWRTNTEAFIATTDVSRYVGGATAMRPEYMTEFIRILDDQHELVTAFLSKIVAEASRIPSLELSRLWVPFLRSLLAVLKANGITLANETIRTVSTELLCAYLNRSVGTEPVTHKTLVRPTIPCDCMECWAINKFLASATQKIGRFILDRAKRFLVHDMLQDARIACTHETDRSGAGQTLVITKTNGASHQQVAAWQKRHADAHRQIAAFDQDDLRFVLGVELYDLVKRARTINRQGYRTAGGTVIYRYPTTAPVQQDSSRSVLSPVAPNGGSASAGSSRPSAGGNRAVRGSSNLAAASRYQTAQVAGIKRPAPRSENIIDLTGDSD